MKRYTWKEIEAMDKSKVRLFKESGLKVYDFALPQQWLDDFARFYSKSCEIDYDTAYLRTLHSTVWSYDDARAFGRPESICVEIARMIDIDLLEK